VCIEIYMLQSTVSFILGPLRNKIMPEL